MANVLVVEDEEMVSDIIESLLKYLGHEPIVVQTGQEGIDTFRARSGFIDLVILDWILPGVGGAEVHDEIRKNRTNIPILISSGYGTTDEISERVGAIDGDGKTDFIPKPFTLAPLELKIAEMLS